jgi:predicted Zn-ribbon and HTH transcriptional regulator
MGTIRQQIMDLLSQHALSAIDLSQELRIPEKEVYAHLPHIARSLSAQGKGLVIMPPRCLNCGYEFKHRKRYTRPGRCPKCRGTYLQRPLYEIRKI